MSGEPLLSTRAQRAFVGIVLLQAIVVISMVGSTFGVVAGHVDYTHQDYKTLPCYLALFILAEIFEVFMTLDALRLRNVIQLIGILLFHSALIVESAIQIHETHAALAGTTYLWHRALPFVIVVPVMIGTSIFGLLYFFRELYHEFGWAIFHVVGADPRMKTMYQRYQVLICLLKFDFFAFTGLTMQLLIVVLSDNTAEFGLTVAAIPIVLILLAIAAIAAQREIKWLMTSSLVLMLTAQVYFYKLVRFYEPSSAPQYASTRVTLTVFTIAASLLLAATFGMGCHCFYDFDKGLDKAKTHGGYYKPVSTGIVYDIFGGEKHKRNPSYNAGLEMAPRLSIE